MSNSDLQLVIVVILVVAVAGYMAYNQLVKVQYINPVKFWLMPLALLAWNIYNLQNSTNDFATVAVVLALFGAGAALGSIRGFINRVAFDRDSNCLIVYGSLVGMLVWLAGFVASVALRLVLHDSPYAQVASPALLLGIFTGWRLIWQLKYNQFKVSRLSI